MKMPLTIIYTLFRHIPNLITTSRLLLAIVFFALLSWYQYEGRGHSALLSFAFFICLVAITTDFVDGYLARKWNVESRFGRVVDPFVDKILVLGSFVFFAGKNFIIPGEANYVVHTITGVTPAMVVVILGRELLVTSLRGMVESTGQQFGADWSGKLKMVLQSVTILVIVTYVYFLGFVENHFPNYKIAYLNWGTLFRDICIWITLVVTVWSAIGYLEKAIRIMRLNDR